MDELLLIGGREYVRLSRAERMFDLKFLNQIKDLSKTDRINFFSSDLKNLIGHFDEPFNDTYSWYVCTRTPSYERVQSVGPPDSNFHIEKRSYSEISPKIREEIISYWNLQYVELIQAGRAPDQKADLRSSIITTLSEGTHIFYRKEDRLVGHGAFVDDVNEVLGLPNLYVHLWTNQNELQETRRAVLAHYFSELKAFNRALTAGIAVNNRKSLRIFGINGFEPMVLSMGVYR